MFCVVFATSSTYWGSSASVLMVSEPLTIETSKRVRYICFDFYFNISFLNFMGGELWSIEIYVSVCIYGFSIFLMLILLTSVMFWFFKLDFISSSGHRDNSEIFITTLDEFKD